jgi:hypothetical protein
VAELRAVLHRSGRLARVRGAWLARLGGCFCGVFAYRVARDLLIGPILAVYLFTAVDVANSLRTIRALLVAAETRALELGCTAVRIRLCNGQAELASRLRTLGLASEIGQFWKKLDHRQSRKLTGEPCPSGMDVSRTRRVPLLFLLAALTV